MIKKSTYLQQEISKERNTIRVWIESGRKTRNILASDNWKNGLGYDYNSEPKIDKNKEVTIET